MSTPAVPNEFVWVFNGERNHFPSGVFRHLQDAEAWIKHNNLRGTLTKYPVGVGVHEWAIASGAFKPKKETHLSADFIANFSSAAQEHHHYGEK